MTPDEETELRRLVRDHCGTIEKLLNDREAMAGRLRQLASAYPTSVFRPLSDIDLDEANSSLSSVGLTLDRVAAHALREMLLNLANEIDGGSHDE